MTMIIDHRPTSRRFSLSPAVQVMQTALVFLTRRMAETRAAYIRRRTARQMEALPFDLRKDIGWPADDTNEQGSH